MGFLRWTSLLAGLLWATVALAEGPASGSAATDTASLVAQAQRLERTDLYDDVRPERDRLMALLDGLLDRVGALRRVSHLALDGARVRVELACGAQVLAEAELMPPGSEVVKGLSPELADELPAALPGVVQSERPIAHA